MFERRFNQPVEHVEQVAEKMRDTTELEGLSDDIRRNLKGDEVQMPWRTGRPLRSAGPGKDGFTPLTPLEALDLAALVPEAAAGRLAAELHRVALHDNISEGVLDHAIAQGVPLSVQETQEEADARRDQEAEQGETR